MYKDKRVIVVMPAYNAAATLKQTLDEIPMDLVDEVVLCDDASKDNTVSEAEKLGIKHIIIHNTNKGCLLYTSPSPRDQRGSRMPSSA